MFGNSSESDSDEDEAVALATPRKKTMTANHGSKAVKPRVLRDVAHWDDTTEPEEDNYKLVHSLDLTSSSTAKEHIPLFGRLADDVLKVDLYYPGSTLAERFALQEPKDRGLHNPAGDVVNTVETVLKHFFPEDISSQHLDESTGIPYLLRRAAAKSEPEAFIQALTTYNDLIQKSRANGTIAKHISDVIPSSPLPRELTIQIMNQSFARTISPSVDRLREYESFSDSVYGEILPPFASTIFKETGLNHESVFLDLGSGVGNVVIQAALETGCEAHGIEYEQNPAGLATQQAEEFRARCRRYGILPGKVHLMQGDFLKDERLRSIIPRADVILTNNYAFSSQTNDSLRQMFLDVKEGARIVSLKSFVPAKWRLEDRTSGDIAAVLKVEKKEFWRQCVSWTDNGGEYFLHTRDSTALRRFLEGEGVEKRSRRGG